MIKDIEPYCVSIDLVRLPKWQAYTNCLLALPTSLPLRVAYYRSPVFVQCIKEVIARQNIELIHGELIKVVPALKAALVGKKIPVLYDSVDCISWFLQQEANTIRNPLKRAFVKSELQKMRQYEMLELAGFDQLIITGQTDRDHLSQLVGHEKEIQIISNCVDTDYFVPQSGPRMPDSLIFCAKLDYFPNAQAILHFCKNTLPLVWAQNPHVQLLIVGNNPPPAVRALSSDRRIIVTGYVSDVRPYLGKAAIALAPLLVAAGTQFKILEALAMSTPMVTMPRCSRALGTQNEVHLLVAEDAQTYADAIVRLLGDPMLAQRLGREGRQFVLDHYSWSHATSTLNKLYNNLLEKRSQKDSIYALPSLNRKSTGA
ncbi:MAG: glycosyltransferase [Ktedonobacteraceae bacterium]